MNNTHINIDLGKKEHGVKGYVNLQVLEYSEKFLKKHKDIFDEIKTLEIKAKNLGEKFDNEYENEIDYTSTQSELNLLNTKLQTLRYSLPKMTEKNSKVVTDLGWNNLITNTGLDMLGQGNFYSSVFTYCAVGTGNSTPTITQTKLDSQPASATTSTYLTSGGGCGTSYPNNYTTVMKRTFDFALGALNGTYAEVGFTPSSSSDPFLFSRSLIQSSGLPTAVTVLSTQQLRVVYTLTIVVGPLTARRVVPEISGWTVSQLSNPTTASQSGTVITSNSSIFTAGMVNNGIKFLDGSFAIITTFTNGTTVTVDRSQTVTSQTFSILSGTTGAEIIQDLGNIIGSVGSLGQSFQGALEPSRGSITGFVSENSLALPNAGTAVSRNLPASTNGTATAGVYSLGTFFKDYTMNFSVNDANHTIRSMGLNSSSNPALTTLLDFDQPKTNLYTLSITFRLVWTRN